MDDVEVVFYKVHRRAPRNAAELEDFVAKVRAQTEALLSKETAGLTKGEFEAARQIAASVNARRR